MAHLPGGQPLTTDTAAAHPDVGGPGDLLATLASYDICSRTLYAAPKQTLEGLLAHRLQETWEPLSLAPACPGHAWREPPGRG
jgi:hypothetical protein